MIVLSFATVLAITLPATAQWPDRHGPTLDSHVAQADAAGLPTEWTETKNVQWKSALHGLGHSSPVIGDGRIWLTTATEDGTKQYVICIDEATGKVLHDKLLFENDDVEPLGGAVGFNNYAAPSPVLADDAVYVHFGTYGTARLDPVTADVVWQRRDLPCRHFRGPGSSPVLYNETLILTFDGIDQQYTTALDCKTGESLWRTDRTTDYGDLGDDGKPKREGDLRKAYCTPGFATVGDQVQVLSVGSKAMQSYDLKTGDELWTVRHTSYNAGVRPMWLPKQGLVILNSGSRGAELIAVRLDKTTKGDVTESHVEWKVEKGNPRFAKPVYHDGFLYQVNDIGVVVCIDVTDGSMAWKKRIGGNYRSSPILAGGNLYFFSEDGTTTIIKASEDYQQVAVNEVKAMGTTACPAVASGALFVRGKDHLFKISGPGR